MVRVISLSIIGVVFVFVLFIGTANAQWNSDWGPIEVEADEETFIAKYNNPKSGIIVMQNEGGLNYKGYWARKCTGTKKQQIPAPVFTSEGSCKNNKKTASGSLTTCWGHISGHANAADTKFTGTFYTCNNKKMGHWNGWR